MKPFKEGKPSLGGLKTHRLGSADQASAERTCFVERKSCVPWCVPWGRPPLSVSVLSTFLQDIIVDCLQADHVSKMTDMLTSYIGLSRVKSKEALLISEPFSPVLFRQGKAIGPEIVMKVLHRKKTTEDAEQEHRCSLFLCV